MNRSDHINPVRLTAGLGGRRIAMNTETCRGCKFYHLDQETTMGHVDDKKAHQDDFEAECRRYPPVRGDAEYYGAMPGNDLLRDCFSGPIVQAIGWCGEWMQR